MLGQRFGKLTVAGEMIHKPIGKKKAPFKYWPVRCDCGNERMVMEANLLRGMTQSCGCLKIGRPKTHGQAGKENRTRLYSCWLNMRNRCSQPSVACYKNYGGRGITVCQEWLDFPTFKSWADSSGYRDDLTIERDDVDGNYEPSNCRWIPKSKQGDNLRKSVFVEAFGERKTMAQWARDSRCRASMVTIYNRLKAGADPETAITHKGYLALGR